MNELFFTFLEGLDQPHEPRLDSASVLGVGPDLQVGQNPLLLNPLPAAALGDVPGKEDAARRSLVIAEQGFDHRVPGALGVHPGVNTIDLVAHGNEWLAAGRPEAEDFTHAFVPRGTATSGDGWVIPRVDHDQIVGFDRTDGGR